MVDIDPVDRAKITSDLAIENLDIQQRQELAIQEMRQLQQMLQAERAQGGLLAKSKVEAAARKAAEKARDEKRREASRKDTPSAKVAAMEAPVEPNAGTVDPAQMMTTDLASLPMGSMGGGPQFINQGGGAPSPAMASDQLLQTPNFVTSGRQTTDTATERIGQYDYAPVTRQRSETFVEPNFEGQALSLQRDLALMKLRQVDQKTYISHLAKAATDPKMADPSILLSHAATLDADGRKQLEAAIMAKQAERNTVLDTARTLIGKYNADFENGLISADERREGIAKVLKGDSVTVNNNMGDLFGLGTRGQNEVDVKLIKAAEGRNRLNRISRDYDDSFYKAGSGAVSGMTGLRNWGADLGETLGVSKYTEWVRPTDAQVDWWKKRATHRGQVINDVINAVYDISGAASREQEFQRLLEVRPSPEDQPPVFRDKMERLLDFGNMSAAALNIAKEKYGSNTSFVPDSEVAAYIDEKFQEYQAAGQDEETALRSVELWIGVQPGYARKLAEMGGAIRQGDR